MKKKNLLILSVALSLSACTLSELGLGDESPNWRPYKDIDQSTQYIAFTSSTTAYFESHPKKIRQDVVGRAYKKGNLIAKIPSDIYLISTMQTVLAWQPTSLHQPTKV